MSDNVPLNWSFGQGADALRLALGGENANDTVDLKRFCISKTLNKREANSIVGELNVMHDVKRRKLVSIEPFVAHINRFAVGASLLTELLDQKGVFAYKTDAACYYKVSDVFDALELKANVADADTRTIFDVDGLMTVGDIMRKVIPTCTFNGTGSTTDFKRLQQRPEETDGANESVETLPSKLGDVPAALQWQYGQDGTALVAALQKFGIIARMHKGMLMLDVEALSDFSIFTKEQALHLWSTVKVVEDHRNHLYIPLDAFVEFVNEKLFASAQMVSDIPEADRIHVKGHVFDRRMLKSALYMVRFLINHPESGYDSRTGKFDLLRAIMFFQKKCLNMTAAGNKKADVLRSNPELAAKYPFLGGNQGFRVTWAEFDLDWIDHMTGDLAQAWKQSMRNLGRMVSVGNVRVIWQILENRQDILQASTSEKAMIADMHQTVEAHREVQLPVPTLPPFTAEQRVDLILNQRANKKELALLTIRTEAEQKRLETTLAAETHRYLMAQPRTAEAAERDAKRINSLTLELDFSRKREASLRQQIERQALEIERLQQQLMAATRAE